MAQGAGVEGREVRRGADAAGDDEFGAMESPTGAGEGQGRSPPVVPRWMLPCIQHSLRRNNWG